MSQGAEGGRLGQDLGLSYTEHSGQGRSDGAQMCQKHLDVHAGCSWNDNQVVGYRFHLLTAAALLGFPPQWKMGNQDRVMSIMKTRTTAICIHLWVLKAVNSNLYLYSSNNPKRNLKNSMI